MSNPALAQTGGQLFDDSVGLFTNCGKPAEECGRVVRQPALATDATMRKAMWKQSKALVKAFTTPLGMPWKPPVKPKRQTKGYIREAYEYAKNQAKWKMAREFCADRQWEFKVVTEKELGI